MVFFISKNRLEIQIFQQPAEFHLWWFLSFHSKFESIQKSLFFSVSFSVSKKYLLRHKAWFFWLLIRVLCSPTQINQYPSGTYGTVFLSLFSNMWSILWQYGFEMICESMEYIKLWLLVIHGTQPTLFHCKDVWRFLLKKVYQTMLKTFIRPCISAEIRVKMLLHRRKKTKCALNFGKQWFSTINMTSSLLRFDCIGASGYCLLCIIGWFNLLTEHWCYFRSNRPHVVLHLYGNKKKQYIP